MSDISPDEAASAMVNQDGTADMDTDPMPLPEPDGDPEAEPDADLGDLEPEPEPEPEAGGSVIDRLFSTEPSPSLAEVEDPWDPDAGGLTRVYRGLQKLGDIEGMPAVVDIGIGVIEAADERGAFAEDDSPEEPDTDDANPRGQTDATAPADPSIPGDTE